MNTQKYVRVKKSPGIIVYVESKEDVRATIMFAKKHKLMVAIQSTGHSFIGRSTHEGGLLINLRRMKGIKFKINSDRNKDGEVTVESGNTWIRVYQEVDKHNRTIVGGSDHNVGMGGYTQGGGHSPICRSLGLAVDNLLEVFLVSADGKYVTASAEGTTIVNTDGISTTNKDTDLFWALRGGGGGTWGVVISFTFKLHKPPAQFVHASFLFPLIVGKTTPGTAVIKSFFKLLPNLSPEWGGYFIVGNTPDSNNKTNFGFVSLSLLHYGKWNNAGMKEIESITNHPVRHYTKFTNYTSFLDYESRVNPDPDSPYRSYIINTLMQNSTLTDGAADGIVDELISQLTKSDIWICTGTLIGGKISEVKEGTTPINPYFRSSLMSTTCGTGWSTALEDDAKIANAKTVNQKLMSLGHGVYFNEPAADLPDWKQQFWGKNYDKLQTIKKEWDPNNFFWCHNCVGSDLKDESDDRKPKTCTSSGNANIQHLYLLTLGSVVLSLVI